MHYYKFNVASWAKDTSHLSIKEEGIYLRLINYYYDTEKPIPLKTHLVLRNHDEIGGFVYPYFCLGCSNIQVYKNLIIDAAIKRLLTHFINK